MLGSRVLDPVAVLVLPVRRVLQLLPAASSEAGVQVGFVDDLAAPVAAAVVVPAMLGHDAVEVLAEVFQRGAARDGFIHGSPKVRDDGVAVGPGHHKRPVMLLGVDVRPTGRGQIEFAPEELGLFLEGQRAISRISHSGPQLPEAPPSAQPVARLPRLRPWPARTDPASCRG